MVTELNTFKGSSRNYTEIAIRNLDVLGLNIEYAHHPKTGVGFLVVRFVAYSKDGEKMGFKHFAPREKTTFILPEDSLRKGMRLNRVLIPLFSAGVPESSVGTLGDDANIWPILASWVAEQAKLDGFTLSLENLPGYIRSIFSPSVNASKPELLLDLPDLAGAPGKSDQELENDE